MPCLGQCLHVGIDGRTHAAKILVSTKNTVTLVWLNDCNLIVLDENAFDRLLGSGGMQL